MLVLFVLEVLLSRDLRVAMKRRTLLFWYDDVLYNCR